MSVTVLNCVRNIYVWLDAMLPYTFFSFLDVYCSRLELLSSSERGSFESAAPAKTSIFALFGAPVATNKIKHLVE